MPKCHMGHSQPEKYRRKKRHLTWIEYRLLKKRMCIEELYDPKPASWLERVTWFADDHPVVIYVMILAMCTLFATLAVWMRK
jgi:hypothetical protein